MTAAATSQALAKPNPLKQLMRHFQASHDLVHCDGKPYAVPRGVGQSEIEGAPGIAQPFGADLRRRIVGMANLVPELSMVSRASADTVMLQLEAVAFRGPETELALRFHHDHRGQVCIDLGRPDGNVIIIDGQGWSVARPPVGVVFRRSHAIKPLPVPERDGRLEDLAPLLALHPHSETFRALLGWVIGLPFVASVRPGVLLVGPYGSGKSTRLRLAASLLEPSAPSALGSGFGRNFGDDQVRAVHRAVPLWDNLTSVSGATSDELCCLITGTARETRALYSDNELNVMPIARPVGLTAVGIPAGLRPDALDRLITLEVPPVPTRIDDAELQLVFDSWHPRLLGALCDAISLAIRLAPGVQDSGGQRMAAHARRLAAIDQAVASGRLPGCPLGMLDAFIVAARSVKQRVVAEDTFGGALLSLLEVAGSWHGKASELLSAAAMRVPLNDRATTGWPSSARRVPEVLNHLREGLEALGVTWSTTVVRGSTRYYFTLEEISA